MSDDAVLAKTGRTWEQWYSAINEAGGKTMDHKAIVAWLEEHYALTPWWQQMVAVTYEQAMGLRDRHEKPDGYEIGVSKTFLAPINNVFACWAEARIRKQWLSGGMQISTSTKDRSLHASWNSGGRITVNFYEKGAMKSQVQVQHRKLPDAGAAASYKVFWKEQLHALAAFLGEE